MAELRLIRDTKALLNKLDLQHGLRATYRVPSEGVPDIQTGQVTVSNDDKSVIVRPLPYTIDELTQLTSAGITMDMVRWRMQVKYKDTVQDGDILIVSSMRYAINKAEKDQLGVEWTLFTTRMR